MVSARTFTFISPVKGHPLTPLLQLVLTSEWGLLPTRDPAWLWCRTWSVGWVLWSGRTCHRAPCSGTAAVAPVSSRGAGAISQGMNLQGFILAGTASCPVCPCDHPQLPRPSHTGASAKIVTLCSGHTPPACDGECDTHLLGTRH